MSSVEPAADALWMPPSRIRRYQYIKIAAGVGIIAVFAGWMVNMQGRPAMWWLSAALILATLWTVGRSLLLDFRRRGRQLAVAEEGLVLSGPDGTRQVRFADVTEARWRNDREQDVGLWLYGADGRVIAHLDQGLLADEAEARAFVRWIRAHRSFDFNIEWG